MFMQQKIINRVYIYRLVHTILFRQIFRSYMPFGRQHGWAIGIFRRYRTISSEAADVIAGLVPLDILIEERISNTGNKAADKKAKQ